MPNTLTIRLELPPELAESYANWLKSRADHVVRQHQWEPRFTRIEDWSSRRAAILRHFPPMLAVEQTADQIRDQIHARPSTQEAN